ncbi:MAG: hypothetical protein ACREFO_04340, partial [Acetobacteraceae bacterium]
RPCRWGTNWGGEAIQERAWSRSVAGVEEQEVSAEKAVGTVPRYSANPLAPVLRVRFRIDNPDGHEAIDGEGEPVGLLPG